jgi:hypothetical protein
VHLLSIYDEYISSYKDRSAIGESEVGAKLIALGNDLQFLILLDGQIAGTWKRTLKKAEALLTTNLFTSLTKAEEKALRIAAERYGAFLGLSVVIE